MTRTGKLWGRVHRGISLVLTVVWVGAGVTKIAGLSEFESVLETHGVLPDAAISWAWVVPAAEVLLGGAIFVAGAKPSARWILRASAVASALLLLAFCVYVAQVDPVVFKTAGCGCGGMWGITDATGSPSRGVVIGIDVVLAGMSLSLLAIPKGEPK